MAHSREYIDAIFNAAKEHLPAWAWELLHKKAFPKSGGAARHRGSVAKQVAPISSRGMSVQELFAQLSVRREQYSKVESEYKEPTTDAMTACGACRFYLRNPHEERGMCQLVMGDIAWFGTCAFYIGAAEEAAFALSNILQKQGVEIQTIVFPKTKWTLARARRWLGEHDFRSGGVDETENSYRFRQQDPAKFERIRPFCLMPNNAAPNMEACSVLAFGGPLIEKGESKITQALVDEEIDKVYGKPKRRKRRRDMMKEIEIVKLDEEKRIVYGIVLDPYIVDTQGDWSPPAEVEKTAHGWMEQSRTIGFRHSREADAVPVESFLMPYPSTDDYKLAMCNEPHKVFKFKFGEGFVHSGSWVLGTKVKEDSTWQLIKSGELGSYSIGGQGEREEITEVELPKVTEEIEVDWSKAA